ncbi:MAG: 1,4-dihydroxy-2-naphthoate octaprenyltransferase [Bacteroidaceae bacterium]|nr:1,4-dihydroxy-2-naphthoate octaprenyltransferase [Bacteroidaceae bacterium]
MTISSCMKSMRLRTLPLSLAGVVMGIGMASRVGEVGWGTVLFLLLTTSFLQILSNLSNELGDVLHGTDTDERQGMRYSIQDGEMTIKEMRFLIRASVGGCCLSGLLMIWSSFGRFYGLAPILFILLGAAAIIAAMRYTLGPNPYGYRGWGDFFVFIFFGLVSTLGSMFICCHSFGSFLSLLPAVSVGLLSVGVLNVNNIRDMKTDARTRTTVALRLGDKRARRYQTSLIAVGLVLMLIFTSLTWTHWCEWLYVVTFPLFLLHLRGVWTRRDKALDPMLPLLVMSTFALCVIAGVTIGCC